MQEEAFVQNDTYMKAGYIIKPHDLTSSRLQ